MVAYSINSLFWAYLSTQGINPKQHPIRNELKRIQEYMGKVKLAEEKRKMARVDTHAAKRFVRNALWQAPAAQAQEGSSKAQSTAAPPTDDSTEEERPIEQVIRPPASKKMKRNEDVA